MSQILFATDTTPNLGDLDANFAEVYGYAKNLTSLGAGAVTIGKATASEAAASGSGFSFAQPTTDPFFSVVNTNAAGASAGVYISRRTVGSLVVFHTNDGATNTLVGSVSHNGTGTAYNTTSDYRLKTAVADLTGSGAFIDALLPRRWTWVGGGAGVGFIAHEAALVSPASVVGEKDDVDALGNPKYQAMEYGSAEFIANIVAELQALRARVAALEAA